MMTINPINGTTMEPPWVFDNYPQRLILASLVFLITVFGLIGNIGIIFAVTLSRKLQTTANAFVVNLSVASGLVCATLPFHIVNMIHNSDTGFLPSGLCSTAGIMCYMSFSGTIVAHALIAIDRVLRITRPNHQYRKIFTKRTVVVVICLAWMYANLSIILAFITDAEFGYNQKYRVCLPDIADDNVATVSLFRACTIDLFILICILICYTGIFIHIYRHNKRLLGVHKINNRVMRLTKRGVWGSKARMDTQQDAQDENGANVTNGITKDSTQILPSAAGPHLSDNDMNYENTSSAEDGNSPKPTAEEASASSQQLSTEEISTDTSSVSENVGGNGSVGNVCSVNNQQEGVGQSTASHAHNARLRSQLNARQVKITINMFLLVAVFIICTIPYVACLIVDSFERIFPYVAMFYALSNAINPAIYAWKHPHFRQVFKPMVHCQSSQISEPTGILKIVRDYQRRREHF